jgi:hypothetical protein
VPKPLHRPKVFIPNTFSPQTAIDSARHGRTLVIAAGSREHARATAELYRDTARAARQELGLGQNVGMLIKLAFGDTYQEAFDYAARTYGYWYHNFFQKFRFTEVFRTGADDPNRPFDLGDERALTTRMIESGNCYVAQQTRCASS